MNSRLRWRIALSERMHSLAKAKAAQGSGVHDQVLIEQVADDLVEHCWPHDKALVDRCMDLRESPSEAESTLGTRSFPQRIMLTALVASMAAAVLSYVVSTLGGGVISWLVASLAATLLASIIILPREPAEDHGAGPYTVRRMDDFPQRIHFYIHCAIAGFRAVVEDERPELFPAKDR